MALPIARGLPPLRQARPAPAQRNQASESILDEERGRADGATSIEGDGNTAAIEESDSAASIEGGGNTASIEGGGRAASIEGAAPLTGARCASH